MALILSRKLGEEIVIGTEIRIKVICIDGERVKLQVFAPASVPINRLEVLERKLREGPKQRYEADDDGYVPRKQSRLDKIRNRYGPTVVSVDGQLTELRGDPVDIGEWGESCIIET